MSSNSALASDVFVPITIDKNDLFSGIKKLLQVLRPSWASENIKFKLFKNGITNKLVACQPIGSQRDEDIVLVRIYGNNTDLVIDRDAEIRNIKALNTLGLAPTLYGRFENGLAYEYYPGITLNTKSVIDEKIYPLVARQMAKMHKTKLDKNSQKEPFIWLKIEEFLKLLPESFNTEFKQNRFVRSFGSLEKLRREYESLKSHLLSTESPLVFAHNDLLLGNVIYNKDENKISFIDFEYANHNYQAYDIANHFCEFVGLSIDEIDYIKYPSTEFQKKWIREYLNEFLNTQPTIENVERLYAEVQLHSLIAHFNWGIWSLVQFEHSDIDFDYISYAEIRLNKYLELKDKLLKEYSMFLKTNPEE